MGKGERRLPGFSPFEGESENEWCGRDGAKEDEGVGARGSGGKRGGDGARKRVAHQREGDGVRGGDEYERGQMW